MSLDDYLPLPAELARSLRASLPDHPYVKIIPRDAKQHRVAAYASDHYEIAAYYTAMSRDLLTPLAEALEATPGVYAVMKFTGSKEAWPMDWPVHYLSVAEWRPQVRALIAHPKDRSKATCWPGE